MIGGAGRPSAARPVRSQGLAHWQAVPCLQPHWHADGEFALAVWQPQVQAAPMQVAHKQGVVSVFIESLQLGEPEVVHGTNSGSGRAGRLECFGCRARTF